LDKESASFNVKVPCDIFRFAFIKKKSKPETDKKVKKKNTGFSG